MRYFSIRNGLIFVGLQFSLLGCMSVPDEAPKEFHTAKATIERADDADVDDYLPSTMDQVERQFDEAVALWKKSRDRDVKEGERSQLAQNAAEKAAKVQATTEQALQLQNQIKAWDNNLESYTTMIQEKQDSMAQLQQLRDQNKELSIASVRIQQQPEQSEEPQKQQQVADAPNIALRGPVAYFSAGSTDVDPRYEANINNLARTLTSESQTKVTLSGYADPRGDKATNNRLARERAEAVAAILRDKGVSADQIEVKAWPATGNRGKSNRSQAQLQLDRRVEAFITTTGDSKQQAR